MLGIVVMFWCDIQCHEICTSSRFHSYIIINVQIMCQTLHYVKIMSLLHSNSYWYVSCSGQYTEHEITVSHFSSTCDIYLCLFQFDLTSLSIVLLQHVSTCTMVTMVTVSKHFKFNVCVCLYPCVRVLCACVHLCLCLTVCLSACVWVV